MNWKTWKNYLVPEVIETLKSAISGQINVVRFQNKIAVWVDGFEQSGPLVEKLWKKALEEITYNANGRALIFGLGCGSVVKVLPSMKVTGVEIDPVMVDIGKRYFNLDRVKIVIGDATKLKFKERFDLIIVDLYIGGKMENLLVPTNFLAKDGVIIYNQLTFGNNQVDLLSSLDKDPRLKIKRVRQTEYNKLIFCSKK